MKKAGKCRRQMRCYPYASFAFFKSQHEVYVLARAHASSFCQGHGIMYIEKPPDRGRKEDRAAYAVHK